MSRKRRLGKGLSALIGDSETEGVAISIDRGPSSAAIESVQNTVTVASIVPNRHQPRRTFDPAAIRHLAESIESQGLIQPVVINDRGDGSYELISGERRLRAIRSLGWNTVPAVIKNVGEAALLEMTLVENLQREDLDPIEEAEGYQQLASHFEMTQAQIAKRVGKDRSTVTNALRLLKLPEIIRRDISAGLLSSGHARQLLALDNESDQIEMARLVIKEEIPVRKLEKMVRDWKSRTAGKKQNLRKLNDEELTAIRDLEDRLRRALSTKVRINSKGEGKGRIEIEYYSFEEFERLLELFDVPPLG
jgi:ParB family transcriptional regulator, chromosome partitioning protein